MLDVKTLLLGTTLFALLAAPVQAKRPNVRLSSGEAVKKAHRIAYVQQLGAFADSYAIPDCDRLSTRRITCRYRLDFNGRIAPCEDRITLTTRWFGDGERYIGWTIGKDAIDCSAGLDVTAVEITP